MRQMVANLSRQWGRELTASEKRIFVQGVMTGQELTFGAWFGGLKAIERDYVETLSAITGWPLPSSEAVR